MSEKGLVVEDIAAAAQAVFYPEKSSIVLKEPVAVEAMTSQALAEGVTIADQVVQITGGPRTVWVAVDATQYVDGEIACALQFLFQNETEWQTAVSFTALERGKKPDETPADEWAAGFTTPFPLPDCQARAIIIVKGAEIKTAATIRW